MRCINCRKELEKGVRKCQVCGQRISKYGSTLKPEQRIEILNSFEKVWGALLTIKKAYPFRTLKGHFWSDSILPFSKELILQASNEYLEYAQEEEVKQVLGDRKSIEGNWLVLQSKFMEDKSYVEWYNHELEEYLELSEARFVNGEKDILADLDLRDLK